MQILDRRVCDFCGSPKRSIWRPELRDWVIILLCAYIGTLLSQRHTLRQERDRAMEAATRSSLRNGACYETLELCNVTNAKWKERCQ
jgi:hypothetical protein